ncbi:MAG: primosomal replication protein N [Betaproteobacteria bacterium]|nr:primosomal replication protein N [Betaproteobacteria bacterium]MCC6250187.1 primosomal replication protein N [Rubrivivax sp.]
MNRFLLSGSLVQRSAMRYTPAGLPALDLVLKHESTVSEDGQPRKVSMEMRAVAIGAVTQPLTALALGEDGEFAGFVTSTRNGRGLLFHITSVDAGAKDTAGGD